MPKHRKLSNFMQRCQEMMHTMKEGTGSVMQWPSCGVMCRVADVFAQMNNKMSGDLKKIQITGRYFVEIWRAIGMESIDDKVS